MDRKSRPDLQDTNDQSAMMRVSFFGYGWAALGVAAATLLFPFWTR